MVNLAGKDILDGAQFTRQELERIMEVAADFREQLQGGRQLKLMEGYVMGVLFFEPSTRTRLSFETAVRRLGARSITVADAKSSSASKGESLADMARTVEGYVDCIVVRQPQTGGAKIIADAVEIPVLNGGDGSGQHPTQALLDVYTIQKEKGTLDGLTVTLGGDLKNGRTVHSLAYLLIRQQDAVGLVTMDHRVRATIPARSRPRTHPTSCSCSSTMPASAARRPSVAASAHPASSASRTTG